MKSNYDVLGNHIQLVERRNTDLTTDRVLGINIDKFFMPSVANVIGTDLSKYKLLTKDIFACNPMHVGRDERLPVALYSEDEPAIVSPAYFMFEIKENSELLPEYLMMWFRRPRFDRNCWFRTDGSVRGGITWDDICRLEVPIPSNAEQEKVIASYKAITDRIELKQKINDNLEDTLYSIFQNSFLVEKSKCFAGNPQDNWKIMKLSEICDFQYGKMVPLEKRREKGYPIFSGYGVTGYIDKYMFAEPIIVVLARGVSGTGEVRISPAYSYITNLSIAVLPHDNCYFAYLYQYLAHDNLRALDSGSAQSMITIENLGNHKIAIPPSDVAKKYKRIFDKINTQILVNNQEIAQLQALVSNFLATLSH